MLISKKICTLYLNGRLNRRGVGLICVRITETVAAPKNFPHGPPMTKKVNIIPVTS